MKIIQATHHNIKDVIDITSLLWESHSRKELEKEYQEIINKDNAVIFLIYIKAKIVGFAHCQLRYDYVEGTRSSPVGYLEGIFVEEQFRKQGLAKQLLLVCEAWIKEKGCYEFASDSDLNNLESYQFHQASGFTEVNRIICYKKYLN
ncbi:aminoglycoside 6'-N-acetyltransferase [Vagococcus sp. JNUCC 83]